MAVIVTTVPERPRRVGHHSSGEDRTGATNVLQSERLDVLVHLRAFLELERGRNSIRVLTTEADWVALSDGFAASDGEPTVAELSRDLSSGRVVRAPVVFGSGGKLLRGATTAAAALHSGARFESESGAAPLLDRSQQALLDLGWPPGRLRALTMLWLSSDPSSALVLLGVDHPDFTRDLRELTTRYDRFHSELDHLDPRAASTIGARFEGSIQVIGVRSGGGSAERVIGGLRSVISVSKGSAAMSKASVLFDPDRIRTTSKSHTRLVRSERRKQMLRQRLDRTRGR